MKTINLIKKSVVITFASIIMACGAETLVALVFIPAFAGPWQVEGVNGYNFSIQSDDQGKESGIISGEESNHPSDLYEDFNKLNGSFKGLSIEFTIKRVNFNDNQDTTFVKYTGKMIPKSDEDHTIKQIELSSPEDNLVLVSN